MGMYAVYMGVEQETLERLKKMSPVELFEEIEDLQDEPDNENPYYNLDKLWDGLHFLLTGVSAGTPVEDDPLSESVVGTFLFHPDDEDADFISYTTHCHIASILQALKNVNREDLQQRFEPSAYKKARLYPNIWLQKEKESLFEELSKGLVDLIRFYEEAWEKQQNVIVSIY